MRDLPIVPAVADLSVEVQKLIDGVSNHDVAYGVNKDGYGKCVEAMSRAAYMAHEAVARELGVTGFQHSMSSLSIVGMLRGIEGPYMIINAEDMLYPQYDKVRDVREWLGSTRTREYLADEAQKKLDNMDASFPASDAVIEHWKSLVSQRPTPEEIEIERA